MASESEKAKCGEWLERSGWLRSVAGDSDFATASSAVAEMLYGESQPRGLMLIGDVGVGKTCLAEAILRGVRGEKRRIDCADDGDVDWLVPESDANANGGVFSSAADDFLGGTVLIDDLGREAIRNTYGNELNRVGNFIVRYHLRGRGRLLITTNLNADELEERYSSRVLDRIFEKCVVARLAGKSKRSRTIIGAKA